METYRSATIKPINHTAIRIVWYITDFFEVLLLFRFFLKLLGANASAPFTNFIYRVTDSFAAPFLNVFGATPIQGAGVFEWNSLLAMLVLYLIALGIVKIFLMDKAVAVTETTETVIK